MDLKDFIHFLMLFIITCIRYECEAARTLVSCPKRNMFIQIKSNGIQKCMTCSPCQQGTQKKRCSLWHDTVCEICPVGTYSRKENSRCKACTVCKPGERVVRKCSPTEDAICVTCPKGTYTSTSNSQVCELCSRCKSNEEVLHVCNSTHNNECGSCTQGYFRESATDGCLPCSKCQGDLKVVPECYNKNAGYSNKNCMPSERMWGILQTTPTATLRPITLDNGDQFIAVLLPFLIIIIFSSIVIVTVFIFIQSSRRTQLCIRKTRDTGRKNTKKLPKQEGDSYGRRKRNKFSEMIQSSWNLIKQYISTDKRIVGLLANENSCCEDLIKENIDLSVLTDLTEIKPINPEKGELKMLTKETEETLNILDEPYADLSCDTDVNVNIYENTIDKEGIQHLYCSDRISIDSGCNNNDEQNNSDNEGNSDSTMPNLSHSNLNGENSLESIIDLPDVCSHTRCCTCSEINVGGTQFPLQQTRHESKRIPMETAPSMFTNTTYMLYATL